MTAAVVVVLVSQLLSGESIDARTKWIECNGVRIKKEHPRIWLTQERLERMRKDASKRTERFLRLKTVTDSQRESSVPFQNTLNYLVMYVATSEPVYAEGAIDKADKLIRAKYADREEAAPNMMAVALVYDWLFAYPGLTAAKKKTYLNWLARDDETGTGTYGKYSQYKQAYEISGYKVNRDQSWHNYHLLGMLGLFVTAAATIESPSDEQAKWLENAINHWYDRTQTGLALNGEGGGSPEDDSYWSESISFLTRFLLAYESATKERLADDIPYYRDRIDYSFFVTLPRPTEANGTKTWRRVPQGDVSGNINLSHHRERVAQWMLIQLFPREEQARYLKSWLTESPVTKTYNDKFAGDEFLWADDGSASLPYQRKRLSHIARGTGRVLIRQDWRQDSTHIAFQCGDHYEYHQHYAQGHFSLFKNDHLIVDSGKYKDTYGSHARNYYYRTIAHNSLLVFDAREGSGRHEGGMWTGLRGGKSGINEGGQKISSTYAANGDRIDSADESVFSVEDWHAHRTTYDSGEIVRYEDTGSYVYCQGDATKAYHPWKVSHFDRSMVYLRERDALVVFDRASVPDYQNKKRILFHFSGEPTVAGGSLMTAAKVHGIGNNRGGVWRFRNADTFVVNLDAVSLLCKTVLPRRAEIVKIGGPDTNGDSDTAESFEYWVPHDGNDLEAGGANYFAASDRQETGLWRVEVSPSTQQPHDVFLHVIYPRETPNRGMPDTLAVEVVSGSMSGTLLDGLANPRIVMFSSKADGSTVSSVTYRADCAATAVARHLLFGIRSGSYDVFKNSRKVVSKKSTTDQNVLSFDAIGHGEYRIARSE